MLTPISFNHHVSRNRNLKALPPSKLIRDGVACLLPATMFAHELRVLDLILVSSPSGRAILTAWPLSAIPVNHIALDDNSISALNVNPVKPTPRIRATPEKKKKSKRKSTRGNGKVDGPRTPNSTNSSQRGRRREISPERNTRTDVTQQRGRQALDHSSSRLGRREIDSQENGDQDLSFRKEHNAVKLEKIIQVEDVKPSKSVEFRSNVQSALKCVQTDEYLNFLQTELQDRVVVEGMVILFTVLGEDVPFEAIAVEVPGGESEDIIIGRFNQRTIIRFAKHQKNNHSLNQSLTDCIGGLDKQMEELLFLARAAIGTSKREDRPLPERLDSAIPRPRGALLYGPPGTGKTLLACSLSEKLGINVEFLYGPEVIGDFSGDSVSLLDRCFERARRKQPCVVVLDEVDAMCPKREHQETDNVQRKVTSALLSILDREASSNQEDVFVVGTTNKLETLDSAMRRAGRFDKEIEIVVPDASSRGDILLKLVNKARTSGNVAVSSDEVKDIARRAYGFVGADLHALWREAVGQMLKREASIVEVEDMKQALSLLRPSALREVTVEIPTTRWSDIGGKAVAKQRLREAIEWPLSPRGAQLFNEVGIDPPRGILLFGPPGCSKTLLARAVASESGANFISIKGSELLSKWVGESEKAVRGIFRKAREAAPCVIFFDEVDALAGKRGGTTGSGVQARVVAQLLAEMDGVERFDDKERRVVVIAATNRPDVLDEAFLRPGRIDVQIYIGLPDFEERIEILKVHSRKMPLAKDVQLSDIANQLEGSSGAEVGGVVREAGLTAVERTGGKVDEVSRADFDEGMKRVGKRTPDHLVKFFQEYIRQVDGGTRVGLTGGIASGKSTVSSIWASNGAFIVDADLVAREVVQPGSPALFLLRRHFGSGILNPDGTLNRAALGNMIFSDAKARRALNRRIHPFIMWSMLTKTLIAALVKWHSVIVLDAPILYESGTLVPFCAVIVVVSCKREQQIERLIKRDSSKELTQEDATKRIDAQMPLEEKVRRADVVIDNSTDVNHLEAKSVQVLEKLRPAPAKEFAFRLLLCGIVGKVGLRVSHLLSSKFGM